jgi:hypothetical protein
VAVLGCVLALSRLALWLCSLAVQRARLYGRQDSACVASARYAVRPRSPLPARFTGVPRRENHGLIFIA